ncbi:MAG: ABC transporter ATP-binding protein [Clostridiales bacterium]|nr:ABC transporter ATP-binding protein [Clostridiales bacterium]
MSDYLLKAEDINAKYGDFHAVQGASFDIKKGEIISVIGTNGAGKSTLMKAIVGIMKPSGGKVYYKGEDVTGIPTHKLVEMGLIAVPEGGRVFPRMTVLDNLIMGSYTPKARKNRDQALERVYSLFPILKEKANQAAGSLSGGQRQMVAIGRALMSDPELVLFDEISLGLAPTVIKDIYATIRQINKEGLTVILVEQDVKRSLKMSTKAYVMLKGKIVLEGNSQELTEEEVKRAYFGI